MAFPSDYSTYQEVTIKASKVPSDLTDYILYVDLADLVKAGDDIFDSCRTDGGDIRVTKTDGTTELPVEIVAIDTTAKTGQIHVKVTGTLSSSSDTVLRVWYNGVDTVPASTATYGSENVWTDYSGVWHMDEASGDLLDSTANSNDMSDNSTVGSAAGQIQNGRDFERGSSEFFNITNAAQTGLKPTGDWTITLWYMFETYGSTFHSFFCNQNTGFRNGFDFKYKTQDNELTLTTANAGSANNARYTTALTTGTKYKLTVKYRSSDSQISFYLDGAFGSTTSGLSLAYTTNDVTIGKSIPHNIYSDGVQDETRLRDSLVSDDWEETEYNNQSDSADFYTVSDEEGGGGGGTDYPITASVGAFTLTGVATALNLGLQMLGALGTFALTGIATGLNFGRNLIADTGTFVLTGINAVLIAGGRLSAEVGTFVLTGFDAVIDVPRKILGEVGEFTLTGIDVGFKSGKALLTTVGEFTLTGIDVVFGTGKGMITTVGNFTLTGFTTTLTWTKRIVAGTGAFILTGIDAILRPSNIWSNGADKNVEDWVNKDKS